MCMEPISSYETPEQRLADIIRSDLMVNVDKHVLRLFIEAKWEVVAPLAHMIHEKAASDRKRRTR